MRKLSIVLLIGLSRLLLPSSAGGKPAQSQTNSPPKRMIGYIKDENLVDMCGCAYARANTAPGLTFLSDGEVKEAWMNIDGQDVKLKLTHFQGSKRRARIGSTYRETFAADGIKVFIVRTVNRLCIPYSPDCETTGYNITITVKKGGRTETVKARGQCGCV